MGLIEATGDSRLFIQVLEYVEDKWFQKLHANDTCLRMTSQNFLLRLRYDLEKELGVKIIGLNIFLRRDFGFYFE